MRASLFLIAAAVSSGAEFHRLFPFGGMRGTTVEVELVGQGLAATTGVWFDTPDLDWTGTREAGDKSVKGAVRIAETAALGPHLLHIRLKNGRTNSRLFNVTQFPSVLEVEPNDPPQAGQEIQLRPQVIHGYMEGRIDIDVYTFQAKAGERWTFDLRSLEYGSHLECEMGLEDERGKRVAFNDDRDDYLETPFIDHTFARTGVYRLKIDQYRGPQGVGCGSNCGYMLQISQLPVALSAFPLGLPAGRRNSMRIHGQGLDSVREVLLTQVRAGEYYRLTFPYSIPIRIGPDARQAAVIQGRLKHASPTDLEAEFDVPAGAEPGLWRLWTKGQSGTADGISVEITRLPVYSEQEARRRPDLGAGEAVVAGSLDREGEEDDYPIAARAGKPLHLWTLATQLGLPLLDTVLELFDSSGKLLAEHDDLMTGQGTVIGNPDSSLYYVPSKNEKLRLVVRDRTGRGGPTFSYLLHSANERPGFQIQTDPEEFTIARGGEAEITALLIREPGFEEGVEFWVEGLPAGATATRGSVRPGQYFGPSDDGDNVIIPHSALRIQAPSNAALGDYPIRVFGKSTSGRVVEAFTTLWIGPRSKRNDIRRPVPATTMTIVDAPQP